MLSYGIEGTEYEEIYQEFLDKLTDYDLPLIDSQLNDSMLLRYLKYACGKFGRVCKIDLSDRDNILLYFRNILPDEVKDIITEYMVLKWWMPKKNNSELLEDTLTSKDFHTLHSPANLLSEVRMTYKDVERNCYRLVNEYSIVNGDIANLRPKG